MNRANALCGKKIQPDGEAAAEPNSLSGKIEPGNAFWRLRYGFEVWMNRSTARQLGITIPPTLSAGGIVYTVNPFPPFPP